MKNIIFLSLALISTTAFASREIYENLAVEEKVLSTTRTEMIFLKTAGGLTCSKSDHVENGPNYSCEIETKTLDAAVIYNSLKAEEVITESSRMTFVYEKSVAALHCSKTLELGAEDSFNCVLKF